MENLLDLLIILFIIYAFLAPVLKRRTPPVQQKPVPYEPETSNETKEEKSSQEILKEIEELFGYKSEEDEKISKAEDEEFHSPDVVMSQKIPEAKFEEKVVQVESRQSLEEKIHQDFKIEAYDYDATVQDTDIEEYDYSKFENYETEGKLQEEKTFELELSGIDDFKKAVIYKEIFDTPLALRMRRIKWQRNIY
jgi:hypothetical protein